jgi:hypothetical protein
MARPRTRRAAAESREKAEKAVEKVDVSENADTRAGSAVLPKTESQQEEKKSSGKRRRPSDISPPVGREDKRRKVDVSNI